MAVLPYCAQQVYTHDRSRFLLSLCVPSLRREGMLALYALNIELAQIPNLVSEEMIGQIRYAWWQEAIDGLYAGAPRQGHPVLEALVPAIGAGHVPKDMLMKLIEQYRERLGEIPSPLGGGLGRGRTFSAEQDCPPPNLPPTGGEKITKIDIIMETISLNFVRCTCPVAEAHWRKANAIVSKHRQRYGNRRNGWLSLKLLMA